MKPSVYAVVIVLFVWSLGTQPIPTEVLSVVPVNGCTLHHMIESSRGHVVVLNFWATWCAPCVAEFPDLVRLRDSYIDRNVDVLLVCANDPTEDGAKVREFLASQHVSFKTFMKQSGDDEAFINAVNRNWSGALPATFLFDRNGKVVYSLTGAQKYATLSHLLEQLLSRPS